MKILLLSPPYLKYYMRNARCDFVSLSATQWYPILLGYCGAYLESKGYEVKLVDAPAYHLDHKQTKNIIIKYKPDLLVLYTGLKSEKNDLDFGDTIIEEAGCNAVIVGPYASIDPEGTLIKTRFINQLIIGEFEYSVEELASGKKPEEIKNIFFRKEGKILNNSARSYLTGEELDSLPFVSKFFNKHVDIYKYKTPSELYPFVDIMTGRGCKWGLCTYCLWVNTFVKGNTYNTRSIGNVIEEFSFIQSDMPKIRSVMIQDDTFTEERAYEFCTEKIKAKIELLWSCYARADIGYDVLRLMKKAGCLNLHVGYESGSDKVLKVIKKGLTVKRMTDFTKDAKRAGLRIHGDFAIGFPEETIEEARKTTKWAYDLNTDTAQFQLMIPFPGTPFYQCMEKNGWLNKNGQPDMPNFTNAQIRTVAKQAYRKFYLGPRYIWRCIMHPSGHFLNKLDTISKAIPAMFWKRWKV